jgi:hypothetical protein
MDGDNSIMRHLSQELDVDGLQSSPTRREGAHADAQRRTSACGTSTEQFEAQK